MDLPEASLIPYKAEPLRGEKMLVLAPHPDDEIIGCGGLMAQHAREMRQVRVIVATDGGAAPGAGTTADYLQRRERETTEGLSILGVPSTPVFLRFPDRHLSSHAEELKRLLKDELRTWRPDIILTPNPLEIHPDHVALSRALVDLVQSSADIAGDLALCRVVFYEVSHAFRPNTIVDITDVAEKKFSALEAHASQLEIRDYRAFAAGLNQFRTLTLGGSSKYAEGYWVTELPALRNIPWSDLTRKMGGFADADVLRETLPVTVVIRTKDRLALLRHAVESVQAGAYPADIVVVNDGGASPKDVLADFDGVRVLEHSTSRGRSEAMNAGVAAAGAGYVAFLDDDDLYYPEHLETLANAMPLANHVAVYTDAISVFLEVSATGAYEVTKRLRLFAHDFDRKLLVFDNYIPLPTLLVSRENFLAAGGFSREFDLFEDWDFLLRLSRRGDFLRIPRVTCEVRHFAGGDSVLINSPAGSARFREAKLRVWEAHRDLLTLDTIADVFESQKSTGLDLYSELIDVKGRANHFEVDIARLERDKANLLHQLQSTHGKLAEKTAEAAGLAVLLSETRERLGEVEREIEARTGEVASLAGLLEQHRAAIAEKDTALASTFAEIRRLNAILDSIHSSRTWKLHTFVEGLKGKRV